MFLTYRLRANAEIDLLLVRITMFLTLSSDTRYYFLYFFGKCADECLIAHVFYPYQQFYFLEVADIDLL